MHLDTIEIAGHRFTEDTPRLTEATEPGYSRITGVGSNGAACVDGNCVIPCGPDNLQTCVVPP